MKNVPNQSVVRDQERHRVRDIIIMIPQNPLKSPEEQPFCINKHSHLGVRHRRDSAIYTRASACEMRELSAPNSRFRHKTLISAAAGGPTITQPFLLDSAICSRIAEIMNLANLSPYRIPPPSPSPHFRTRRRGRLAIELFLVNGAVSRRAPNDPGA